MSLIYRSRAPRRLARRIGFGFSHHEPLSPACKQKVVHNSLTRQMSTGVSYFEQFVWNVEQRGVSNIDIPVLVLGIDA
jgi:hypothetical protein